MRSYSVRVDATAENPIAEALEIKEEEVMEIARWNPWHEIMTIRDSFRRMHGSRPMFDGRCEEPAQHGVSWHPAVDVYETDDAYVVSAELPGMKKEDIDIDVKDRILTVKGRRSSDAEVRNERYYRKERVFGSFQRAFSLPEKVDPAQITAEFKSGVLKISIPRPEEKKPRQITVH
jgi:HSP20 family protein